MNAIERVDRTLAGKEVDRPPVSFWYHFGIQHEDGRRLAETSLAFFRYYELDWLKLMNDYFYPMPPGMLEVKTRADLARITRFDVRRSDWANQLAAIQIVARELAGKAYFVDTVFDPWQVLMRNLAGEHLPELAATAADAVLDALDVISDNVISYCREALRLGCSGVFISTFGSRAQMPRDQYLRFAKPFVMKVLDAVKDQGNMHTAHVHDIGIYVDDVLDFPVPIISYEDRDPSNPPIPELRRKFPGTVMGGLDKKRVTRVTPAEAVRNAQEGMRLGGPTRFLLAPGCTVPSWLYPGAAKALVEEVRAGARG